MKIITPTQFKTIPWKNGKGVTTELAISPNGTLDKFDWRLSIATVAEDGSFSNFNGLCRNLILIEGNGIRLAHLSSDGNKTYDELVHLLDIATFDGGVDTEGELIDGTIKDFNLMHNPRKYDAKVMTITEHEAFSLEDFDICFIYSLNKTFSVLIDGSSENTQVPINHLLQINDGNEASVKVEGEWLIVIRLYNKAV